jgi:phosphoglycolate phosphatase-like HAD superfamily hydrolase
LGASRLGSFKVVLLDFERTLVRLFEDGAIEQQFFREVWDLCARRGVPARVLRTGGESPYSLWRKAHRWMQRRNQDPLRVDRMYHAVASVAKRYEMVAAETVRLFDDVPPVLDRLKAESIVVVIVSNNATNAVERILRDNNAEGLVDHVVGRDPKHELIGNLKPKPLLLMEALRLSRWGAHRALLVGDSVDDMRAGRAAKIRLKVGVLDHSAFSEWQLRRAGADLVLNRFGDLMPLLPGGDESGER